MLELTVMVLLILGLIMTYFINSLAFKAIMVMNGSGVTFEGVTLVLMALFIDLLIILAVTIKE